MNYSKIPFWLHPNRPLFLHEEVKPVMTRSEKIESGLVEETVKPANEEIEDDRSPHQILDDAAEEAKVEGKEWLAQLYNILKTDEHVKGKQEGWEEKQAELERQRIEAEKARAAAEEQRFFESHADLFEEGVLEGVPNIQPRIKQIMKDLIAEFGDKIKFTSGYRSMGYNIWTYLKWNRERWSKSIYEKMIAQVNPASRIGSGGEQSSASAHTVGTAFDFQIRGFSKENYEQLEKQLMERYPGIYALREDVSEGSVNWLHLQVDNYEREEDGKRKEIERYNSQGKKMRDVKLLGKKGLENIYINTAFNHLLEMEAERIWRAEVEKGFGMNWEEMDDDSRSKAEATKEKDIQAEKMHLLILAYGDEENPDTKTLALIDRLMEEAGDYVPHPDLDIRNAEVYEWMDIENNPELATVLAYHYPELTEEPEAEEILLASNENTRV